MITTTLNDQNHILENCIGSVIYFFILTHVPFVYMERAGFMTCTAANHQGAIKEPAASLFRRCETHPVQTIKNLLKKAQSGKSDPYIALLEYRNTPLDGIGYSLVQLLMGRRLKSKIPTSVAFVSQYLHV